MTAPATPGMLSFIEKEIGHLPFQHIQELIRTLSPSLANANQNLFQSFYKAIIAEYEIRLKYGSSIPTDRITWHIICTARKVNQQLSIHLQTMLEKPFFVTAIRKIVEKNLPDQRNSNQLPNKGKSGFNFGVIRGIYKSQLYPYPPQPCVNLQAKPQCICLNQREIATKDEFSFRCAHCHRLFHAVCFKKKHNAQSCSYCYLQKMIPIKKVIKTVFIGLMRKTSKRHEAKIVFPQLAQNQKLEIRCLRVKEGAQNSCIFPDITEIRLNENLVESLQPISKNSCLKYRKDQPLPISKGDFFPGQENSFVLDERLTTARKQRQFRCESQNHIIAIYVIEQPSVQALIDDLKLQSVLGFSQSKDILSRNLKSEKADEQISFQVMKIPVNCPMSASRIEIPARGLLCTHFKCFDLKNYLIFISKSQNPRWKCPICPQLAYQLQIDPIIQQILNQNKDNPKIQEIMFLKNGDYGLVEDDNPLEKWKNINDLNILQKKAKRLIPELEEKVVNTQFKVPVNAEIIDLDD